MTYISRILLFCLVLGGAVIYNEKFSFYRIHYFTSIRSIV